MTCVRWPRWPASDQYKVSPPSNCIFIIIWPPPATASSPAVSNHKTRLQPEKSMIKKCLDFSSGTRRHLEESILNMWPTGVSDLCLKTENILTLHSDKWVQPEEGTRVIVKRPEGWSPALVSWPVPGAHHCRRSCTGSAPDHQQQQQPGSSSRTLEWDGQ